MTPRTRHQGQLSPPSEADTNQANKLLALLEKEGPGKAGVVGKDGKPVPIRGAVYHLFMELLDELRHGRAVSMTAVERDLTTQQAANLLGISRPSLIKRLDKGELPHRLVGRHRRVPLEAVLAYRERESLRRRKILARLTQESQKMGLYDDDAP